VHYGCCIVVEIRKYTIIIDIELEIVEFGERPIEINACCWDLPL
jgi:hypothetical protein